MRVTIATANFKLAATTIHCDAVEEHVTIIGRVGRTAKRKDKDPVSAEA